MSEPKDTSGLSMRELLLEVRQDVKNHLANGHSNTPTRAEMFAGLVAVTGVVLAAVNF